MALRSRSRTKINYTPREVAQQLGVHHNTIKNWIRRGIIEAFQTVGGHFRVSKREVARMVSERGLPVPEEFAGSPGMVYVLAKQGAATGALTEGLGGRFQVVSFSDPFDALMQMGRLAPDLLVVDVDVPGIDALALAHKLRDGDGRRKVPVMGFSAGFYSHEGGFDGFVAQGGTPSALVDMARGLLPQDPPVVAPGTQTAS